MNYAHNAMWKCSDDGLLSPISAVQTYKRTPNPSLAAVDAQHKHIERAHMLSATVAEGVRQANTEPQLLATQLAVEDMLRAHQQAIYEAPLEDRLLGMDLDLMPAHTGAKTRHQESRHFQNGAFRCPGLHVLGDVAKELPEDEELNAYIDAEIPGLNLTTERSFDFVEAEVRTQLSHLSRMKQDAIVSLLETYEPTVFETRTMPRLAPHRQWDLDITEEWDLDITEGIIEEGTRPVAARPYPVAPQHLPELDRQIAHTPLPRSTCLNSIGKLQHSRRLVSSAAVAASMAHLSCLHQRKMENCGCVLITANSIDRHYLTVTPHQWPQTSLHAQREPACFRNSTSRVGSTSCASKMAISIKLRL